MSAVATEYGTRGTAYFPEFFLPLLSARGCLAAERESDYYTFILVPDGILTIVTDGETRILPAPIALLAAPGHGMDRVACSSNGTHSIVFRPDAINTTIGVPARETRVADIPELFFFRPFRDIGPEGYEIRPLEGLLCAKLTDLCAHIHGELTDGQSGLWPCMTRSYFLELLILLERTAYPGQSPLELRVPETSGYLVPIYSFLHSEYSREISLDGLAARFGTNRTTLNAEFRASCGMPVMCYLNRIRLDVAASLLRNTELPVFDIALRAGFSDESYFGRAFKKRFSLPPLAYRKSFPNPYGHAP